ncbi:hypothetical protein FRC19_007596 [Serendipita sp. 401]|nr:hypothetical protein FRC19_007596 [Serendipita sp. 401]
MEPFKDLSGDSPPAQNPNINVREDVKLCRSPHVEKTAEEAIPAAQQDTKLDYSPFIDHGESVDAHTEASGSDHFSTSSQSRSLNASPEEDARSVEAPCSTSISCETSISSPPRSQSPAVQSLSTTSPTNSEQKSKLQQQLGVQCDLDSLSDRPTSPERPTSTDGKRTYSFVFTSSRQQRTASGDRVIGIVNPSMARKLSNEQTVPPLISDSKPSLKPEQIRVHALGAVHAISENSPFRPQLRTPSTSAVAQFDLPIQTPLSTDSGNPIDRSLQAHGIDFYVSAARAGRGANSDPSSSSGPRPGTRRVSSYTTVLSSLGETLECDTTEEPSSPTSLSDIGGTAVKRKRRMKHYTRYVEEESEYNFTTMCTVIERKRDQSLGSSCSSANSKYSIDESLSGLSAFGTIGSASAPDIFGPGSPSSKLERSSSGDIRPSISQTSSSSTTRGPIITPDPTPSTHHSATPD